MPSLTPRRRRGGGGGGREFPAGLSGGWRRGASDGGAEIANAGDGMRVTRAGRWWRIVCVRDSAEVAPASNGRGGPRAHDVDGR